jgi:uncharacterized membrane protein
MDEVIRELEELTGQLLQQIDQATEEQLLRFVEDRQLLVDRLAGISSTDEQRQLYRDRVAALNQHDERILIRLMGERNEALEGLSKLDTAKKQKGAYQSDYAADSYYFDKKK